MLRDPEHPSSLLLLLSSPLSFSSHSPISFSLSLASIPFFLTYIFGGRLLLITQADFGLSSCLSLPNAGDTCGNHHVWLESLQLSNRACL